MVLGTTSGAGKTVISAMICRHIRARGKTVSPFKALNISLNSFVTKDGGEIGISQAFQAWACGIEPQRCHNPFLIKPKSPGCSQLIVKGDPYKDSSTRTKEDMTVIWGAVKTCFEEVDTAYEYMVCEGSGSPAEINLREKDIANIGLARHSAAPILLVGDIEKGGVFAGLYGTYCLLPDDVKKNVAGFVINRFRGEASLLDKGIKQIEDLTGCPCLGVIPYISLSFPSEDSLDIDSEEGAHPAGSDIRGSWVENIDRFIGLVEGHFDFPMLDEILGVGE